MPDTELLTDQQIAEIEARANAATKGPWIAELRSWPIGDTGDYEPCADVLAVHGDVAKPRAVGMFHELSADVNAQAANCAFTAHARADIPALIATVKQLREQLFEEQARNQTQADSIMDAESEITSLQSQLEQLRAENERLRAELEKESLTADAYAADADVGDSFRSRAVDLCNQKAAEYERAMRHRKTREAFTKTYADAVSEIRKALEAH